MIFHFQAGNGMPFNPDHQLYFEDKFRHLNKFLERYGQERDKADTVEVRISLNRDQHHQKGPVIDGRATIFYPGHGRFHAETREENLKACADGLVAKLRPQIEKFKAHQTR